MCGLGAKNEEQESKTPSFIFWFSFNFSRDQNRKSPSTVSFCSETKRKRLLRRLVYLEPLSLSIVGDFSWSWIFKGFIHVQMEKGEFVVVSVHVLHETSHWEVTRRSRAVDVKDNSIVLKSLMDVPSSCFADKTNCFLRCCCRRCRRCLSSLSH